MKPKPAQLFISFRWILLAAIFFFFSGTASAQLQVEDFRQSPEQSDSEVLQNALDSLASRGRGSLSFEGGRKYTIDRSLELPRYSARGHFILEGNGCFLQATSDTVSIFNRIPRNQREALDKMVSTRFVIQDFSFRGGAKGINLGASLGTAILRCNFFNHHEAAVDIQFGLQTRIEHCYTTNCYKDNFVLRTGTDWGGSNNNSQSNHSVVESCRVFARKDSKTGFKVLGSGGVVLSNIISEGHHDIDYAIYADRLNSTTVRRFVIENFHLEHTPKEAGIYLRISGNTEINGVYYQMAREEFPLVQAGRNSGLIELRNIPHYVKGTVMKQEQDGGGAIWAINYCYHAFYNPEVWRIRNAKGEYDRKLPYYFSGQQGGYQIRKKH
jgi:hypothetical protein